VNEQALAYWVGRVDDLESRLKKALAFVDDPGNWSALDGRRKLLRAFLTGAL
jgi:hypothetical protein